MKMKPLLLVLCLCSSHAVLAQTQTDPKDTTAIEYAQKDSTVNDVKGSLSLKDKDKLARSLVPAEGMALVYILRPTSFAMLIRMGVHCDSTRIGSTKARNFLYAMLTPGTHTLQSNSENHARLTITVEAGKIYFVKQEVNMGLAYAETGLQLLDEQEGQKYLKKCSLAKDNLASNGGGR